MDATEVDALLQAATLPQTLSKGADGLEGFSLLSVAYHAVCLVVLYHAHLVTKICLVSFLDDLCRLPSLSSFFTSAPALKKASFNLGVSASLFILENAWLLPKHDWPRVLAEGVAISTIAFIDHF